MPSLNQNRNRKSIPVFLIPGGVVLHSIFRTPKPFQQLADFRSNPFELRAMSRSQFFKNLFAATRELDQDVAAIFGGWFAGHEFFRHQPVNQTDGAMVSKLQS